MSETGYDEDFEDYDDDFESDHELEVPHRLSDGSTAIAGISGDAWPSLSAAAAVKHKPRAANFTRSLINTGASAASAASDGISITISPAPPPPTDSQRRTAAKTLSRALQRKQQLSLVLTPVYELLVLQPLSSYQQLTQGVGVYADVRAAACQTGQLGQEVQEQDAQTDQIEVQDGYCQVPDVQVTKQQSASASATSSLSTSASKARSTAATAAAAARLLESDAGMVTFLDWAIPEIVYELGKAAATASLAAEGARTADSRHKQLSFTPVTLGENVTYNKSKGQQTGQTALITGQLLLQCSALLAGRSIISLVCPPTVAAATAAAAAISSVAATPVSSHLLLGCCSPVAMSAEAALKEHGLPGMGCLCIWDLKQQQPLGHQAAAAAVGGGGSVPVQVLVSEGRPSCCCWGTGAGSHLIFAGMEEGGICCWDLSEVNNKLTQQQQQQQQLWPPPRRPSYSTEVPLSATALSASSSSSSSYVGVDRITAVAAVQPAGGLSSSAAGAVCQLISLSSAGGVTLYSVMVAASAAAAAAVADLGMRTGSRVWLVKTVEGLPLGLNAAKPPHLRSTTLTTSSSTSSSPSSAAAVVRDGSALAVLPGPSQQLLVGVCGARILKGACLGTPGPPREYIAEDWQTMGLKLGNSSSSSSSGADGSDTAAVTDRLLKESNSSSSRVFGSVVSLSVSPVVSDAWLAGFSSGGVALFNINKSRPVLLWQQMRPAAVVAVRWVPTRPCAFLVLHSDGQLLAVDLADGNTQPNYVANIQRPRQVTTVTTRNAQSAASTPCSMEVFVSHSSGVATSIPTDGNSSWSNSKARQFRSSTSKAASGRLAVDQGGNSSAAVQCCVAVGFDDGTTVVYQLGADWTSFQQRDEEEQQLLKVLGS